MHDEETEVVGERDQIDRLRPAIEINHMILSPENRGDLVEEPAAYPDEFVFRAAADFGEIERRNLERVKLGEQDSRCDLDRGRTRQARSQRQVRGKIRLESSGGCACLGQHLGDTERIVFPAVTGFDAGFPVDRDDPVDAFAREHDFSVIPPPAGHADSHLDCR